MAVAVKNAPATTTVSPPRRLEFHGADALAGVAYTVASIWIVCYGLPLFWSHVLGWVDSFMGVGVLVLAMACAACALGFVGLHRLGPHPRPGLKSSIAIGSVLVVVAALLTSGLGQIVQAVLATNTGVLGAAVTVGILVLLLATVGWLLTRPSFERFMVALDGQGWFTSGAFKRTQGQRIRRGTILGILILAGCGIYTLLVHWAPAPTGQAAAAWEVYVPFSGGETITLLPVLRITVPVLLALAAFWFAYRVVNLPVFADFLIATEAEMNKVSWTTRRRLVQDTIVVLVTVFLLTVFLFVVDWGWSLILRGVGVIQTPTQQQVDQTPHW